MATKRKKGDVWEYTVKRAKLLPKPLYLRFDTEEEGDAYVARLESMLDRGIVPDAHLEHGAKYVILGELIRDYLAKNVVPPSDTSLLNVQYERVGTMPVQQLNYAWVERWVASMKTQYNLSPSTIRHHVGAMARCFDWAGNKNVVPLVSNPIRQLPTRYAQYTTKDTHAAVAYDESHTRRSDAERDRRLEPAEEVEVRRVLNREVMPGKQRAFTLQYQAAFELLFDLALETAMRMREMYSLTLDQVDIGHRTVFLDKTKNGSKRQVPLSSVALARIAEYKIIVEKGERGMEGFTFDAGLLFPWWDGVMGSRVFPSLTAKLSEMYGRIFREAGCADVRFHDLRHEATSRFFERTKLADFEIMKITGHSSTRMLARYGNLRGSKLADKLW